LVIAMITRQNSRICSQPLKVMCAGSSEFLGPDQREDQIAQQADRDDRAKPILECHGSETSQNRSQAGAWSTQAPRKTAPIRI
jgi:hypothetical protein